MAVRKKGGETESRRVYDWEEVLKIREIIISLLFIPILMETYFYAILHQSATMMPHIQLVNGRFLVKEGNPVIAKKKSKGK